MGDRMYLGKPENQKDLRAANVHKNKKPQKQQRTDKPLVRPKPVVLPVTDEEANMRTGSPFDNAIFGRGIVVRETHAQTKFDASTPTILEVSRSTFQQMATDTVDLTKTLLPEYLDYYITYQLWCRLVAIKAANQRDLSLDEQWLIQAIQSKEYNIPSPIAVYLRSIGNLFAGSQQHLFLESPPLPVEKIGTKSGFFGPLNADTHNLYEELPCLGVLAEAIQDIVSDKDPGPRNSVLSTDKLVVNSNLLGFLPLSTRRSDAKDFATAHGITPTTMNETRVNTGINIEFINAISDALASISTFKVERINHLVLTRSGQRSQLIPQYPLTGQVVPHTKGELMSTSFDREKEATFGTSFLTCSQLFKVEKEPSAWACATPIKGEAIPQEWITNRNIRRNLPFQYYCRTFTVVSQNGKSYRDAIISSLILIKR